MGIAERTRTTVNVAIAKEAVSSPNPLHPGLLVNVNTLELGPVRPIKLPVDGMIANIVRVRTLREQHAHLEEVNAGDTDNVCDCVVKLIVHVVQGQNTNEFEALILLILLSFK